MAVTYAAEVDSLPEQLLVQQTHSVKEAQHAEEPILFNISIPFPLKQWLSTFNMQQNNYLEKLVKFLGPNTLRF